MPPYGSQEEDRLAKAGRGALDIITGASRAIGRQRRENIAEIPGVSKEVMGATGVPLIIPDEAAKKEVIPTTDQAGVMHPMPVRPAVGGTTAPLSAIDVGVGGGIGGPVDLTPRLRDISTDVASTIPPEFDVGAAHKLGMERYPEGQVYLPPGLRAKYGDVMDSVLGPEPSRAAIETPSVAGTVVGDFRDYARKPVSMYGQPVAQPEGDDPRLAEIMSRATAIDPAQAGAIPVPTKTGNAMVDLFNWRSYNAKVGQQNKMLAEQKKSALDLKKFEEGQLFKEKKLTSEEKRAGETLKLGKRKALAVEEKAVTEKLDPFVKDALDRLEKSEEFKFMPEGPEKTTMRLEAIERAEKLHGRKRRETKPKVNKDDYVKVDGKWYKK